MGQPARSPSSRMSRPIGSWRSSPMVVARRFDTDPSKRREDGDRLREPTGFACSCCGQEVGGELACGGCANHTHCPFCGACFLNRDECEHQLQLDGDEDQIVSVLEDMGVPDWPEDGEGGRAAA